MAAVGALSQIIAYRVVNVQLARSCRIIIALAVNCLLIDPQNEFGRSAVVDGLTHPEVDRAATGQILPDGVAFRKVDGCPRNPSIKP